MANVRRSKGQSNGQSNDRGPLSAGEVERLRKLCQVDTRDPQAMAAFAQAMGVESLDDDVAPYEIEPYAVLVRAAQGVLARVAHVICWHHTEPISTEEWNRFMLDTKRLAQDMPTGARRARAMRQVEASVRQFGYADILSFDCLKGDLEELAVEFAQLKEEPSIAILNRYAQGDARGVQAAYVTAALSLSVGAFGDKINKGETEAEAVRRLTGVFRGAVAAEQKRTEGQCRYG